MGEKNKMNLCDIDLTDRVMLTLGRIDELSELAKSSVSAQVIKDLKLDGEEKPDRQMQAN